MLVFSELIVGVLREFAADAGLASLLFSTSTMASLSEEEQRIETVSQFLLQSPPGEINDVLNGTVGSLFDVKITHSQCLTLLRAPRCSRAHRGR